TFFYTQKSSIISMVDLPTTDIIEPIEKGSRVDRTLEPFQYILLLGAYLTPREDEIRSLIFDV
ncbi:hypothetical protein ACJBWN_11670, partial [Streptococcus suis]